jgi:hypothetical protein
MLIHVRSLTIYKYTYAYSILMNTFERLIRFELEIHKVGHQ